ncbi:unnamed protein product [Acanthosepion pharaonis]|uniref:Uncharacterized protein n=1 Tax=Acanthosepion pharaonis TaxID=158019 RepID=A0A812BLI1_ACAPH|nr:unnamed protein product [Sepia pharaonis]
MNKLVLSGCVVVPTIFSSFILLYLFIVLLNIFLHFFSFTIFSFKHLYLFHLSTLFVLLFSNNIFHSHYVSYLPASSFIFFIFLQFFSSSLFVICFFNNFHHHLSLTFFFIFCFVIIIFQSICSSTFFILLHLSLFFLIFRYLIDICPDMLCFLFLTTHSYPNAIFFRNDAIQGEICCL